MGPGNGFPRGARVIHYGADEMLIYQHYVPDGEITFLVQEGTQHAHPLSNFLSNLVNVRPLDESSI